MENDFSHPFTIQVTLLHSVLLKVLNFRNILHYVNKASLVSLKEAAEDGTIMRGISE